MRRSINLITTTDFKIKRGTLVCDTGLFYVPIREDDLRGGNLRPIEIGWIINAEEHTNYEQRDPYNDDQNILTVRFNTSFNTVDEHLVKLIILPNNAAWLDRLRDDRYP